MKRLSILKLFLLMTFAFIVAGCDDGSSWPTEQDAGDVIVEYSNPSAPAEQITVSYSPALPPQNDPMDSDLVTEFVADPESEYQEGLDDTGQPIGEDAVEVATVVMESPMPVVYAPSPIIVEVPVPVMVGPMVIVDYQYALPRPQPMIVVVGGHRDRQGRHSGSGNRGHDEHRPNAPGPRSISQPGRPVRTAQTPAIEPMRPPNRPRAVAVAPNVPRNPRPLSRQPLSAGPIRPPTTTPRPVVVRTDRPNRVAPDLQRAADPRPQQAAGHRPAPQLVAKPRVKAPTTIAQAAPRANKAAPATANPRTESRVTPGRAVRLRATKKPAASPPSPARIMAEVSRARQAVALRALGVRSQASRPNAAKPREERRRERQVAQAD